MALTKEEVNAFVRLDIDPGTITWQRGTEDIKIKKTCQKRYLQLQLKLCFLGRWERGQSWFLLP